MTPTEIKATLKELHISARVVVVVVVVGIAFLMYRNYREVTLINLQIAQAKKDINGTNTTGNGSKAKNG